MDPIRLPDPFLSWTRLSAAVYLTSGGRYKISRRGPSVWILIDTKTGREMRFDLLNDAQSRAQWEALEAAKTELATLSDTVFEAFKHLYERPLAIGGPYHCRHATIKVCFSSHTPRGHELAYSGKFNYAELALITTKVRIEVFPADVNREKFTITVPAAEAAKILGPSFPSEESLYRVICEVYERKNYPVPEPVIPGGGGKSMTAQGQTKKPDAHSHKKHH